jgi:hypothetical protein
MIAVAVAGLQPGCVYLIPSTCTRPLIYRDRGEYFNPFLFISDAWDAGNECSDCTLPGNRQVNSSCNLDSPAMLQHISIPIMLWTAPAAQLPQRTSRVLGGPRGWTK